MSNRAERRRFERANKKSQRKEEKKMMKKTSNASQYNAKKSCKMAPYLTTKKENEYSDVDIVVGIKRDAATAKMSSSTSSTSVGIRSMYAMAIGDAVAEILCDDRLLIYNSAYDTIFSMRCGSEDFDPTESRTEACSITDIVTSIIGDVVQTALIETDFDACSATEYISCTLHELIGNSIVQYPDGGLVDLQEGLDNTVICTVCHGVEEIIACALKKAIAVIYKELLIDDSFEPDEEDSFFNVFHDKFLKSYMELYGLIDNDYNSIIGEDVDDNYIENSDDVDDDINEDGENDSIVDEDDDNNGEEDKSYINNRDSVKDELDEAYSAAVEAIKKFKISDHTSPATSSTSEMSIVDQGDDQI